eukprot:COSAG06_NODE_28013_length_582_cov_0.944099_1_plen_128_part_01
MFGRSHEYITLSEGGSFATRGMDTTMGSTTYPDFDTASKAVMRAGRHYVQFTVSGGSAVLVGVIRPGWDVEERLEASEANGHCFYDTGDGRGFPGGHSWEGRQRANEEGDRIGLLLDLDQGSMTVYKN